MMVGDQRGDAPAARQRDAFKTGDAVVDGNQQPGRAGGGQFDNGGTESVAVALAVGHDVVQMLCAHRAQGAQGDGAGGGAVAVVIGNDENARLRSEGVRQQTGGALRIQ